MSSSICISCCLIFRCRRSCSSFDKWMAPPDPRCPILGLCADGGRLDGVILLLKELSMMEPLMKLLLKSGFVAVALFPGCSGLVVTSSTGCTALIGLPFGGDRWFCPWLELRLTRKEPLRFCFNFISRGVPSGWKCPTYICFFIYLPFDIYITKSYYRFVGWLFFDFFLGGGVVEFLFCRSALQLVPKYFLFFTISVRSVK